MGVINIPAEYYQQFDADVSFAVPARGYGGWKRSNVSISFEKTALVVMHAWDTASPEMYPGWWRCVEYLGRAKAIGENVFPGLLDCVRKSGFRLYHVASSEQNTNDYPGYKRARELAADQCENAGSVDADPVMDALQDFRAANVFVGKHNESDIARAFQHLDFMPSAKPVGDEGIAKTSSQLYAMCKADGINHLIYTGFAINWCLLLSPGGMSDMSKYGIMCSTIKQAVTAVENKETAENELCKQVALWRVALAFGFVFDVDDFAHALKAYSNQIG